MNKFTLSLLMTLLVSLTSYAQYRGTRQNVPLVRTEDYVTNSPGNSIANSKLIAYYKDSTAMGYAYPSIEFWNFKSNRNDGIPTRVLWLDNNGFMKISPMPSFLTFETDPLWNSDKVNYYDKTTSDGKFLQSFTEIDPTVPSFVKSITNTNISNWNIAFGWGNHAIAGYLTTSLAASTYQPVLGFTPYNATNPNGFITNSALSPYQLSANLGTLAFSNATIPTNTNQLINGANFISSFTETDPTVSSYAKSLTNFSVIKTSTDVLYKDINYIPSWIDITSKPSFATIATSGQYSDLLGLPNLSNYYLASNPNNYINSYTETDPIWNTDKLNFRTKIQNDLLYQPIGSYLISEVDPIWTSVATNYKTKTQNDLLYQPIGSYLTTEVDPTVPAYSKSLSSFTIIKNATDNLYKALSYVPSWTDITSKPTFATVSTSGSYNDLINKPIFNPIRVYGSSGEINNSIKIWTGSVVPSVSSGATIDISSAGFSTILTTLVTGEQNVSTIQGALVMVKTDSPTQLSVNTYRSAITGVLLLNTQVPGLEFHPTPSSVKLNVTVIGY